MPLGRGVLLNMDRRQLLKAMLVGTGGLLLPNRALWAESQAKVSDIRLWTAPDHTRVVFAVDRNVRHNLFRLKDPERLVLDIFDARLATSDRLQMSDAVVTQIRTGSPEPGVIRTVFELKGEVRPRTFMLQQTREQKARLVLDLFPKEGAARETPPPAKRAGSREVVVALDPGHGGEDPGAVGAEGTYEKHVVLAVARKLERYINAAPGMRAHLTRTGDYYVPLGKRVSIARNFEADFFISIHADAFTIRSARGASVYCLSEKGKPPPDRAVRQLVERENSADLIGGVDLSQVADREVAGILMDLSQRDAINRGLNLGKNLMHSLKEVTGLKFNAVQQAGFMVLKAPDIPSTLVELAFLSNPQEEKLLRQESHQDTLARALLRGAQQFAKQSVQADRR